MTHAIAPHFREHPDRDKFKYYAREFTVTRWTGRLDYLASGDHQNVFLYFSDTETGECYRLCVFKRSHYSAGDRKVCFNDAKPHSTYDIVTQPGVDPFPTFVSADACTDAHDSSQPSPTASAARRLYGELKKAWMSADREQALGDYPELNEAARFESSILSWAKENTDLVPDEDLEGWVQSVVLERIAALCHHNDPASLAPCAKSLESARAHELKIIYATLSREEALAASPELAAVYEWDRLSLLYLIRKRPDATLLSASKIREKVLEECFVQIAQNGAMDFPDGGKLGQGKNTARVDTNKQRCG